jgi:hypothetical protein
LAQQTVASDIADGKGTAMATTINVSNLSAHCLYEALDSYVKDRRRTGRHLHHPEVEAVRKAMERAWMSTRDSVVKLKIAGEKDA